jgi:hypothetical protein
MATQSRTMTKPCSLPNAPFATALLLADRKRVAELFAAYDKADAPSRKEQFVAQIRIELQEADEVGEEIEETFYPPLSAGAGAG